MCAQGCLLATRADTQVCPYVSTTPLPEREGAGVRALPTYQARGIVAKVTGYGKCRAPRQTPRSAPTYLYLSIPVYTC